MSAGLARNASWGPGCGRISMTGALFCDMDNDTPSREPTEAVWMIIERSTRLAPHMNVSTLVHAVQKELPEISQAQLLAILNELHESRRITFEGFTPDSEIE